MGWNTLNMLKAHPLLEDIPLGPDGLHAYFVHSYELKAAQRADLVAQADYGGPLTAIVGRDNMVGTQFHPEKSQKLGLAADREFFEVDAVILFPAIDLKEGLAVRLEQGDMARATVFHRDPAAQARAFELQGFEYLHIVDLDGAFAGKPVNAGAVERILEAIGIPVQLGGGVRDMATVEAWLDKGVNRVIIGTAAVRNPALVKDAAKKFPGRIAVGLDARDGKVAVQGWAETLGTVGARYRAPLRGCRRRGHHLYRHRARRLAQGSQSRRNHSAGRSDLDSGDRLGRAWPRSRTSRRCSSRAPRNSKAPSPAARSMTGGSMRRRR